MGYDTKGAEDKEIIELINDKEKYWALIYNPELASHNNFFNDLEETFYDGEKQEEFLLIFLQPNELYFPFASIMLAGKEHMSKEQLEEKLIYHDYTAKDSFISDYEVLPKKNILTLSMDRLDEENRLYEIAKTKYIKWKKKKENENNGF